MTQTLRIAIVMGSIRDGRLCPAVTDWLMTELGQFRELELSLIDPADIPMQTFADPLAKPILEGMRRELASADAFILVTPEYNHSYPAALKFIIDSAYEEWQTKPVGFVSYGGVSGGIRAVEHLRQVFAELQSVSMRDAVSLANVWELFDEQGQLIDPRHPQRTLHKMLEQLGWWAVALRNARAADCLTPRLSPKGAGLRLSCT